MSAPDARAKELFLDALELPAGEREAFLAAAGDAALQARVRALLAAHEQAPAHLGQPGRALRAALESLAGRPGDAVGPFTLVAPLGEGGFGRVWRAAQQRPVRREVALKLLKPGMDSAAVLARFAAERELLALMDHPHIARVLDAGADARGRPWVAMELVDGPPVTTWCEQRALPLRARLALFLDTCRAVAHAHQKGVLHRDLKPGNVLVAEVDGRAVPKVIDFGIAKAVGAAAAGTTALTAEGHAPGTPAHMAPEQLDAARDVDTRADVWGLGTLLYELLAGAPPFAAASLAELQRHVREQDPPRPSLLRARRGGEPRVPADLDWIALRCLEKDRERRYASVDALSEDVQRFLDERPVQAAPPSTLYRVRKLVRRHRAASLAGAVVLLALAGSVAAVSSALVEARRQARVAREVAAFLNEDVLGAVAPLGTPGSGPDTRLATVLDEAAARLDLAVAPGGRLHGEPLAEAGVRHALGGALQALGLLPAAEAQLARAAGLRTAAAGPDDRDTLSTRLSLADVLRRASRFDEARALAEDVLRRQRATLGPDHADALGCLRVLGLLAMDQGRLDEAEALLREAVARAAPRGAADPEALDARANLAIALVARGQEQEAEALFREVLAARTASLGPRHPLTLASALNLANHLRGAGALDESDALYAVTVDEVAALLDDAHPDTLAARHGLARLRLEQGRLAEAETLLRELLPLAESTLGPDALEVLEFRGALGRALEQQGRLPEAETEYRAALAAAEQALGSGHPVTLARAKEVSSVLFAQQRLDEALPLAQRILEGEIAAFGAEHPAVVRSLVNLAILELFTGRPDDAEARLRDALARSERAAGSDDLATVDVRSTLAGLLLETGRPDEALPLAQACVDRARAVLPPGTPILAQHLERLGDALDRTGRPDEAHAAWSEAHALLLAAYGPDHPWTQGVASRLAPPDAAAPPSAEP